MIKNFFYIHFEKDKTFEKIIRKNVEISLFVKIPRNCFPMKVKNQSIRERERGEFP